MEDVHWGALLYFHVMSYPHSLRKYRKNLRSSLYLVLGGFAICLKLEQRVDLFLPYGISA